MAVRQAEQPTTQLSEEVIEALRAELRGALLLPGEAGYDAARTVQNGMIDRRPGLIAQCSGVADVIAAVNFAREHDLLVAIRGGGHNVAGNAVCDGGLVIDLSAMRGVHVDPRRRTVRVEGGATWAEVDRETQVHGLATPGGVISTTGVAGLTLHGGMGLLRRKYGLSIDNLLAVDVVTADGQVCTASASENADLFWAIRGAGSNFGVVTSLEFRVHPLGPTVAFCSPLYALEDAAVVLPAWRAYMASAPDEVSSNAVFWAVPSVEAFPEELHGRPMLALASVYAGDADEGARILQPLRELAAPLLDLSGPMPYTAVQTAFDPFFPKGLLCYWKSLNVDALSDDVMAELRRLAAERPAPEALIVAWYQGGAVAGVGATETAFGRRDAQLLVSFDTSWTDPADSERCIAWTRAAWNDMRRHSSGGLYLNFAGFGEEQDELVRSAYGENYARLVRIKTKYDPTNFFRVNNNIKPAV